VTINAFWQLNSLLCLVNLFQPTAHEMPVYVLTMQPVEDTLNVMTLKHASFLTRDSASAQPGRVMLSSVAMQALVAETQ